MSRPNSRTPPSGSVLGYSSSRTERRSLLSVCTLISGNWLRASDWSRGIWGERRRRDICLELGADKLCGASVPNDGCLNFVDENDEVLLAGFGRKGKAKGDIPGVRFKVVKVSGVGLSAYVPQLSRNRVPKLTGKIVYGKKRKRNLARKKLSFWIRILASFFFSHSGWAQGGSVGRICVVHGHFNREFLSVMINN